MNHAVALGISAAMLAGCAAFSSFDDRVGSEYARWRTQEWRAVTVPLGHVLGGDIWDCQARARKKNAAQFLVGPFLGPYVEREMERDAVRACMEAIGWQLPETTQKERQNWAAPHE